MTDYSQVDKPFREWTEENNLPVYTIDRDWEIRATKIELSSKASWNLWLNPNSEMGTCEICYTGTNPTRSYKHNVSIDQITSGLNVVLGAIRNGKLDKRVV